MPQFCLLLRQQLNRIHGNLQFLYWCVLPDKTITCCVSLINWNWKDHPSLMDCEHSGQELGGKEGWLLEFSSSYVFVPPLLVFIGFFLPQSLVGSGQVTPLCCSPPHDPAPSFSVVSCGSKAGGTLREGREPSGWHPGLSEQVIWTCANQEHNRKAVSNRNTFQCDVFFTLTF